MRLHDQRRDHRERSRERYLRRRRNTWTVRVTIINGGVQISNTGPGVIPDAPSIALENSTINGSVHLSGNSGVIAVAINTIAGGLFCSNNLFDLVDEGVRGA